MLVCDLLLIYPSHNSLAHGVPVAPPARDAPLAWSPPPRAPPARSPGWWIQPAELPPPSQPPAGAEEIPRGATGYPKGRARVYILIYCKDNGNV